MKNILLQIFLVAYAYVGSQNLGKGQAFSNRIIFKETNENLTQELLVQKWSDALQEKIVNFRIASFYNPEKNVKEYLIIGENNSGTYSIASKLRWDKKQKTFFIDEKGLSETVTCKGCENGCKPILEYGQFICSKGCKKDNCVKTHSASTNIDLR